MSKYKRIPTKLEKDKLDNGLLEMCKIQLEHLLKNININNFKSDHINFFKTLRLAESLNSATIEGSPLTYEQILISEANFEEIYTNTINIKIDRRKHRSEEFQRIIEVINLKNILDNFNSNGNFTLSHKNLQWLHSLMFKNIESHKVFHANFDNIGKYRETPVRVIDTSTREIIYSAPDFDHVEKELEELIRLFNHKTNDLEEIIINAGLIHALYERIHPFSDGNGRLGRLLIPLYFSVRLNIPAILFISKAVQKKDNIVKYYDSLRYISEDDNYVKYTNIYLRFLLESMKEIETYNNTYLNNLVVVLNIVNNLNVRVLKSSHIEIAKILIESPILTSNYIVHMFNTRAKKSKKMTIKNFREEIAPKLINSGLLEIFEPNIKSKNIYYKSLLAANKI